MRERPWDRLKKALQPHCLLLASGGARIHKAEIEIAACPGQQIHARVLLSPFLPRPKSLHSMHTRSSVFEMVEPDCMPPCPDLFRASRSVVPQVKTWMAGTSPAMTRRIGQRNRKR